MRILSIDYGKKRLGIAVSDELGITAQPLETIVRNNSEFKKLQEIITKYQIEKIIIGLPLNMNGTKSPATAEVENFINKLKTFINTKIEFIDERLSTTEINKRLVEFDIPRKKRKKIVDKLSATILLETYLEKNE